MMKWTEEKYDNETHYTLTDANNVPVAWVRDWWMTGYYAPGGGTQLSLIEPFGNMGLPRDARRFGDLTSVEINKIVSTHLGIEIPPLPL
jgi:hypothetical protein